jgi:hypothetical protein
LFKIGEEVGAIHVGYLLAFAETKEQWLDNIGKGSGTYVLPLGLFALLLPKRYEENALCEIELVCFAYFVTTFYFDASRKNESNNIFFDRKGLQLLRLRFV